MALVRSSARPLARRATGVLALTGLALVLVACNGGDEKKAEAPATPAATTQNAAADQQKAADQAANSASDNAAATEPAKTAPAATPAVQLPEPEATAEVAQLMQPDALGDLALGDENAPVTVVEYASLTCGHCAAFDVRTFPDLKKNYIDTGKVRFILRPFPFDPLAEAAFLLTRCNEKQYYPMVGALFNSQEVWARAEKPSEALFQISRQAGFTEESFNACLKNADLLKKIRDGRERANKEFGVNATPTFFINGKKYAGDLPYDMMSGLIDREMK